MAGWCSALGPDILLTSSGQAAPLPAGSTQAAYDSQTNLAQGPEHSPQGTGFVSQDGHKLT